jgi:hypothetical protein
MGHFTAQQVNPTIIHLAVMGNAGTNISIISQENAALYSSVEEKA